MAPQIPHYFDLSLKSPISMHSNSARLPASAAAPNAGYLLASLCRARCSALDTFSAEPGPRRTLLGAAAVPGRRHRHSRPRGLLRGSPEGTPLPPFPQPLPPPAPRERHNSHPTCRSRPQPRPGRPSPARHREDPPSPLLPLPRRLLWRGSLPRMRSTADTAGRGGPAQRQPHLATIELRRHTVPSRKSRKGGGPRGIMGRVWRAVGGTDSIPQEPPGGAGRTHLPPSEYPVTRAPVARALPDPVPSPRAPQHPQLLLASQRLPPGKATGAAPGAECNTT